MTSRDRRAAPWEIALLLLGCGELTVPIGLDHHDDSSAVRGGAPTVSGGGASARGGKSAVGGRAADGGVVSAGEGGAGTNAGGDAAAGAGGTNTGGGGPAGGTLNKGGSSGATTGGTANGGMSSSGGSERGGGAGESGGGGAAGGDCTGPTDAEFCAELGFECGRAIGVDRCGVQRVVARCGVCVSPEVCGAAEVVGSCAPAPIQRWETVMPAPTSEWLTSVWAASASDVWAVGLAGAIVHWDGSSLTRVPSPTALWLNDVWGSAHDDIWAASDEGGILHYDGREWSWTGAPCDFTMYRVAGRSANDLWALCLSWGPAGFFHWDGFGWTEVYSPSYTNAQYYDVGVAASGELWAFGVLTTRFAGTERTEILGEKTTLAAFLRTANDVWVSGYSPEWIWRFDGQQWSSVTTSGMSYLAEVGAIWADERQAVITDHHQSSLYRMALPDGTAWDTIPLDFVPSDVTGIPGGDVFAVGSHGQMVRWNGSALQRLSEPPLECQAIDGTSTTDVWVGCTNGVLHWDGTTWSKVASPIAPPDKIESIWAEGPGIWLVAGSALWHRDGLAGAWTAIDTPFPITAIKGRSRDDLWVITSQGGVAHFDGESWTPGPDSLENAYAIWVGPNSVWAFGRSNFRYDGSSWTQHEFGSPLSVHHLPPGVSGTADDDVWFVGGENGSVLHWDGAKWNDIDAESFVGGVAVHASSRNSVYVMGERLFHYDGVTWENLGRVTDTEAQAGWGSGSELFLVGDGIQRYQ